RRFKNGPLSRGTWAIRITWILKYKHIRSDRLLDGIGEILTIGCITSVAMCDKHRAHRRLTRTWLEPTNALTDRIGPRLKMVFFCKSESFRCQTGLREIHEGTLGQ